RVSARDRGAVAAQEIPCQHEVWKLSRHWSSVEVRRLAYLVHYQLQHSLAVAYARVALADKHNGVCRLRSGAQDFPPVLLGRNRSEHCIFAGGRAMIFMALHHDANAVPFPNVKVGSAACTVGVRAVVVPLETGIVVPAFEQLDVILPSRFGAVAGLDGVSASGGGQHEAQEAWARSHSTGWICTTNASPQLLAGQLSLRNSRSRTKFGSFPGTGALKRLEARAISSTTICSIPSQSPMRASN